LHQNSQKHNQLEKPPISWHPSVNVIYVWLIFFLLPTTPIAYVCELIRMYCFAVI
jgi:hypothetical protein